MWEVDNYRTLAMIRTPLFFFVEPLSRDISFPNNFCHSGQIDKVTPLIKYLRQSFEPGPKKGVLPAHSPLTRNFLRDENGENCYSSSSYETEVDNRDMPLTTLLDNFSRSFLYDNVSICTGNLLTVLASNILYCFSKDKI